MKRLLLLMLALILCLTACQKKETTPETETEEEKPTQEQIVNYMALTYVNGGSTDANYQIETDVILPERQFICEDVVSNPAEQLAYEYFYAIGTGEYEYLVNHTVGAGLKREIPMMQDAESKGLFYKKLTLHEMEIVPIEQFFDFQYEFCEEVATLAGASKLTEYTVVKARASYEFNDLSLEMNPDLADGEVTLYIFAGRTDGDYFLFETYDPAYVERQN